MSGHGSSTRAILYAFMANLGIAIAKGIAAFFTGSGSMVAESIHSLADCVNQLLLLLGLKRAAKPPTPEHPLGFGKVTYFWSFIVAILLFSVGGLFSIYEGAHKLASPEPVKHAWVALSVLGVSLVLEGISLAGALREIKHMRGKLGLWEWVHRSRNAELIVVMGEDIAALAGLGIAFVFVALAWLLNAPMLDAVGSICIGVILILVSFFLVMRVKALLIGRSADPELQETIRAAIESDDNILEVFNIITMQFGPAVVLAAKVRLPGDLSMDAGIAAINALEARIKADFPEVRWSFIEPDVSD